LWRGLALRYPESVSDQTPTVRSSRPAADHGSVVDATIKAGPGPETTGTPFRLVDAGRFILGQELARGGMGRVLRAFDADLRRTVAVKELLVEDPALLARFEREALITAGLQHPGIVNIIEAGRLPDGTAFYAMKLVTGRPFDHVVAMAGEGFRKRLALLPHAIAVVEALAYAHSKRVIHRDLKPSNVLVGEFGETVVIDWGIAKDLTAAPASTDNASDTVPGGSPPTTNASGGSDGRPTPAPTSRTSDAETIAGQVMGTPGYMPPEQAAGRSVDERADVYALGGLLYYLLAGRPLYEGKSAEAVIGAVLAGPPRPLSSIEPQVPDDLVAIVDKAMARDPANRYPTARELAEDLRRFHTGQLVAVHHYTAWQLARRFVRRHVALLSVIGAAVIALTTVGTVAFVKTLRARRAALEQQALAEQARHVAEDKAAALEAAEGRDALEQGREHSDQGTLFAHVIPATPEQDFAKALDLLTKACDAQSLDGCMALATMYDSGEGCTQDGARALALYQQACNGGLVHACVDVGQDYEQADGVAQDYTQAMALYRQACNAGDAAGCTHLAFLYQNGLGVPKDARRAVDLYQESCNGNDADGCIDLAVLYQTGAGVPEDASKALALYQRACEGGIPDGCTDLGLLYEHGAGVTQDPAKAFALYQRACDEGDPLGCSDLGLLYTSGSAVPQDYAKAADLYERACNAGAVIGCGNLGTLYAEGHGVPKNPTKAATLYATACDQNPPESCAALADLYATGTGVTKDPAQAQTLLAKACTAGDKNACNP
jgi:TPR repeat protein